MKIELKTGFLELDYDSRLKKLVGFGSRINKKRGFLFVSKVLGKHLPTKPSIMKKTYNDLAKIIPYSDEYTLFIGFAETATALGQGVFEEANLKNSFYIHSTRYKTSKKIFLTFFEEHCHAPSHIFYEPIDEDLQKQLLKVTRIILVDDEVSTGNTANNIIKKLNQKLPNVSKYYLLTILNWANNKFDSFEYLSLYQNSFTFNHEKDFIEEKVISETENISDLDKIIPYNFGRYGTKKINISFKKYVNINILKDKKILVLGTSEFMYIPYLFAKYLEENYINTYFQATTRSPVNIDKDISSKISFKDNYFESIDNFLYNVTDREYDKIFICYETTSTPNNFKLKECLEEVFEVEEVFFNQEEKDKFV